MPFFVGSERPNSHSIPGNGASCQARAPSRHDREGRHVSRVAVAHVSSYGIPDRSTQLLCSRPSKPHALPIGFH